MNSSDTSGSPDARTLRDSMNRPLRDMRISVTDRCNFRCVYCMPKEVFGRDFAFLPKASLLTFDEITRIARIAVRHGVEKLRLTGGEPLLRVGLEELIGSLSALRTPEGRAVDVALTTNGSALVQKATSLKNAGLSRVTVSLDSLDDATFRSMNDIDFPVERILRGIDAAHEAGLSIKINMVVKRGHNDHDILPMARYFRGTPHILRFIEYMDVGSTNGWRLSEVLPSAEAIRRIDAEFPVTELSPNYSGETSARWAYRDGAGEIGVISSVTQSFCQTCTRVRLSTEGKLFTCLFSSEGHDVRGMMRKGCSDDDLSTFLANLWVTREDRYSDLRSAQSVRRTGAKKVEMSYIGG